MGAPLLRQALQNAVVQSNPRPSRSVFVESNRMPPAISSFQQAPRCLYQLALQSSERQFQWSCIEASGHYHRGAGQGTSGIQFLPHFGGCSM